MKFTLLVTLLSLIALYQGASAQTGSTSSTSGTTINGNVDATQLGKNQQQQTCQDQINKHTDELNAANARCAALGGDDTNASDADEKAADAAGTNNAYLGGLQKCSKQLSQCGAKKPSTDDDDDATTDDNSLTICQRKSAQKRYDTIINRQDKLDDRVNKANDGVAEIEKEIAKAQTDEANAEKSLKDAVTKSTNDAQTALLQAQKANGDIDKQLSSSITSAQEALNKTKQDAQSKIVAAMAAEKKYADSIRQLQLQCEAKVKDALKQNGEVAFVNTNALSQSAAGGGVVQNTCKTNRAAVYGSRDAEEQKQQDLKQITNELSADQDQMTTILQRMQDDTNAAATDKKNAMAQATVAVQNAQKEVQGSNQALQQQQQSFQTQMQALQGQLASRQLASKQAYQEAQDDQQTKVALQKQGITDDGGSNDSDGKASNDSDSVIETGKAAADWFSQHNLSPGEKNPDWASCTGTAPPAGSSNPGSGKGTGRGSRASEAKPH